MQFQTVEVPFGQGPNEKLDPTLLPTGVLVSAAECLYDKLGAISKRGAFLTYPNSVFGGATLSDVKRIASYKDELLLFDGHKVHSLDETNSKWIDKCLQGATVFNLGQTPEPYPAVATVMQDPTGGAFYSTVCENAGIRAYTFADNNGKVILKVIDTVTGATIQSRTVVATGNFPNLVAIGQYIWVVYSSGTNISGNRIDATAPNTIGGPVVIVNTFKNTGWFDVTPLDSSHFVIAWFGTSGGDNVSIGLVTNAGVVSSSAQKLDPPINSLGVVATAGEGIYVNYHQNTNGQRCWAVNAATLVDLFAPVTVNATTVPISSLSAACRLTSTSTMLVWREDISAGGAKAFLRTRTISNAGALGTLQSTYGLMLSSKPFVADGHMYALVQNSNIITSGTKQPTYFLVDLDIADLTSSPKTVRVVAALKSSSATGRGAGNLPLPAATATAGQYVIVGGGRSRTSIAQGHSDLLYEFKFDFTPAQDRRWLPVEFGQNAVFTGSVLTGYDGQSLYELGFFLYPEFGTATANTTGTMVGGTYAVAFIYEWRDARGQRFKSVPQIIAGIVVVGPTGSIDVTVPPLNITSKTDRLGGNDNAILISVYVTDANGTVFYYNKSFTNATAASASLTGTITAVDTTAEQLYTTGSVLENSMPPACTSIAVHDNRLWVTMADDPRTVRYSKELTVGESPAFNEGLAVRIDDGGDITALASMDDKLVVFKATRIFVIAGLGAVDTGTGSSLNVIPVLAETGCTEPRSVVTTPEGIFFRGAKGIYLLSRSLDLTYVGANVEQTLSLLTDTQAATLLEDARRVVFSVSAGSQGELLVFDTLTSQWCTWNPTLKSTHGGGEPKQSNPIVSTCIHRGRYVIAASRATANTLANGPCWYYDKTTFADDALYIIPLQITTGPIRVNGPQGWQRVHRVTFNLTWKSAYGLNVNQYNDYPVALTAPHPVAFDSNATATSASTGQVSYRPKYQKCEAMSFGISDVAALDASFGEGFSIAGMTLEIGVEPVTFRLPSQART